jgi:nicotinamidase-related amidase
MALAVLIVDMQVDFFAHARLAQHRAELTANINELTRVAREHDVPVIWVKTEFEPDLRDAFLEMRKKAIRVVVKGSAGAGLLPELHVAESDLVLTKKRYSAFFGTVLDSVLTARECSHIIVAGVNTHACIRSTVVDAYQRDLEVILPRGCFDSHDAEHHEISLRYLENKLATVRDLASLATVFDGDLQSRVR